MSGVPHVQHRIALLLSTFWFMASVDAEENVPPRNHLHKGINETSELSQEGFVSSPSVLPDSTVRCFE
jgi:hypothetical protein